MLVALGHRQRVQRILNHQEADRLPLDLGATGASVLTIPALINLQNYLGLGQSELIVQAHEFQVARVNEEIMRHFDVDFRPLYCQPLHRPQQPEAEFIQDEWGITWQRPTNGHYYICNHPLAEAGIESLEAYPWPNLAHPARFVGLQQEALRLYSQTDYALVGVGMDGGNLFETAWMLRGFERFLLDLADNQSFAHALLAKILELRKQFFGRYLELVGGYIEVVCTADDLAMQNGPLISLETYRSVIKPYQKEYFRFIKERTPAKLFYHCCGSVVKLLDDFVEIGVDILNPVQVGSKGMDTRYLKEKYGRRLSFWGGIDTQRVLPHGTVEDVRREVRTRMRDLAAGGGYVLAPVHAVQPDVPPQNLCALYEEGLKAGSYPLAWL